VAGDIALTVNLLADPPGVIPVVADVSTRQGAEALVRMAEDRFGRLDILFNNAGIERLGTVVETSEETWHEVLDVNLKSVFLCCKYAFPRCCGGVGAPSSTMPRLTESAATRTSPPTREQGRNDSPDLFHCTGLCSARNPVQRALPCGDRRHGHGQGGIG